jgi:hypothetical protein
MKLNLSELTTERKWRAATGLDKKRFYVLLPSFSESYVKIHTRTLAEKQSDINSEFCIKNEAELLYFTLFSLKSGLGYDLLGIVSGMDASNAKRQQTTGIEVLNHALQSAGYMPIRKFLTKLEFDEFLKNVDILLIDATEQRIQRPNDKEIQQDYFSGKKKVTH